MSLRGVAGAALVLASLSQTAAAETIFIGRLLYTKAQNCSQQSAGSLYNSTYIPSRVGSTDPRTIITETYDLGGHSYILGGGRFTSQFQTVTDLSHGQGVGTGESRIRITLSDPPDGKITPVTDFIWLEGQIERPQGDYGVGGKECVMSFRASYTRK